MRRWVKDRVGGEARGAGGCGLDNNLKQNGKEQGLRRASSCATLARADSSTVPRQRRCLELLESYSIRALADTPPLLVCIAPQQVISDLQHRVAEEQVLQRKLQEEVNLRELSSQRTESLVISIAELLPLPAHATTALTSSDPTAVQSGLLYLEQVTWQCA